MGFGAGYNGTPGAVVGNIAGLKELTTTVNLTKGANTITHNLGASYTVTGWIVYDSSGNGVSVEPPYNRTANTFQAMVAAAENGCTVYILYKHV
jgi:hypothetical protein